MFEEVDPNEIPDLIEGRRGRVSYPLLKAFLESGIFAGRLDRTGIRQTTQALKMSLNSYLQHHPDVPVKVVTRAGELYFLRTDVDAHGNIIAKLNENMDVRPAIEAPPGELTPERVLERLPGGSSG